MRHLPTLSITIEVCAPWAAAVVQDAMLTQDSALRKRDRVSVTAGPFAGRCGYVLDIRWCLDEAAQRAEGPAGYTVDLDGAQCAADIDADQLEPCSDLRWPHLPDGVPDQPAARFLSTSYAPAGTCTEDLEEILGRATNPQAVPEPLRRTIAGGHSHHHLEVDWQASPAPRRFTWRILEHWYQLTERYTDEQTARLFEVVVTRHLLDPAPTHHLALNQSEITTLIARCTTEA